MFLSKQVKIISDQLDKSLRGMSKVVRKLQKPITSLKRLNILVSNCEGKFGPMLPPSGERWNNA